MASDQSVGTVSFAIGRRFDSRVTDAPAVFLQRFPFRAGPRNNFHARRSGRSDRDTALAKLGRQPVALNELEIPVARDPVRCLR
jgi:hypothetical protein